MAVFLLVFLGILLGSNADSHFMASSCCSCSLSVGSNIMGYAAVPSSKLAVLVTRNGVPIRSPHVFTPGDAAVYEATMPSHVYSYYDWAMEISGAQFSGGLCASKVRIHQDVTNKTFRLPASIKPGQRVSLWAGYAENYGPVSITPAFVLVAVAPLTSAPTSQQHPPAPTAVSNLATSHHKQQREEHSLAPSTSSSSHDVAHQQQHHHQQQQQKRSPKPTVSSQQQQQLSSSPTAASSRHATFHHHHQQQQQQSSAPTAALGRHVHHHSAAPSNGAPGKSPAKKGTAKKGKTRLSTRAPTKKKQTRNPTVQDEP